MLQFCYSIPIPVLMVVTLSVVSICMLASRSSQHPAAAKSSKPLGDEIEDLAETAYRKARRAVMIVVGITLLLVGLAMAVLPGPAVVVIPIALSILGSEFVWARKMLRKAKKGVRHVAKSVGLDGHLSDFLGEDGGPAESSTVRPRDHQKQ